MDAYVQLTGNIGGAIEFRNNGVPIASFRLAHTPRIRRNGEWVDAPTTWITVTCFRGLAENVAASLQKGHPVLVAGRLRTNVWSKEGVTYERLVLEASTVGHDLSRGLSTFQRSQPLASTEDREDTVGELLHSVETQPGDAGPDADDESFGEFPDGELTQGAGGREQIDADGVVSSAA
jgi:single-strand DNA-binding protein